MRRLLLMAMASVAATTANAQTSFFTSPSDTASNVHGYHGVTGALTHNFVAFGSEPFGATVAAGDINGDGRADIIAGTTVGDAQVRAFNGEGGGMFRDFNAFAGFVGGITVAAGDVDGDGKADIITATGNGGGQVKAFSGVTSTQIRSFTPYAGFTGGIRVATGDVNGDGRADIITGAGSSSTHVKVFDGVTNTEIRSFFAYDGVAGGVFVAAGDLNGDGFADIMTGTDEGFSPHVKVFSGLDGSTLRSFFAYTPTFMGGVRVAVGDVDGDGVANMLTGSGPGTTAHVKLFNNNAVEQMSFLPYGGSYSGGIFVAAPVTPVPEPATFAAVGLGLAALLRRRQR